MMEILIFAFIVLLGFVGIAIYLWWKNPYRQVAKRIKEMDPHPSPPPQVGEGEKRGSSYLQVDVKGEIWVKVPKAAELAGVSRWTVWRMVKNGKVRHKNRGKHYLVALEDVLREVRKR